MNFAVVRSPNTFVLLGSNDSVNWNLVDNKTNVNWTNLEKTFTVSTNSSYSVYRLVTTVVGNSNETSARNSVQIARLRLFGSGGSGFLSFNAQKQQHLQIPSKSLNIESGGGFTALARVRLSDTTLTGRPQRIFDLGSSSFATGNITLSSNSGGNLRFTTLNIPTTTDSVTAVTTWTTRTSTDNNWISVCWSPELSLFAAVSYSGTLNRIMTSPDGITWSSRTTPVDNEWFSIIWAAELSLFVAVSRTGSGNAVMTSSDGITWVSRTSPSDNGWRSVTWAPEIGLLVAVSQNGNTNRVMTSPDGINWTGYNIGIGSVWASVCWSPERRLLVAVSYSGTGNGIMTSSNGISWTTRANPVDNQWYSVTWSPELGLFVASAITGTGNRIMTSSDGLTWITRSSAEDNEWFSVTWSRELSLFVAAARSGTNRIMTSHDGINWTTRAATAVIGWRSICWSPQLGIFTVIADTGTGNRVMTTLPVYKGATATSTAAIPANSFATIGVRYRETDARVALDSRQLTNFMETNTGVYDWGSFIQQTASQRPTYASSGGYKGLPYVSFNRTNSQHLQLPSITLNMASNGGFTSLAVVRFTGTAGISERIFDFGNGQANNNILFYRDATSARLAFYLANNSLGYFLNTNSQIVQNEWALFACRYNTSTNFVELFKNGTRVASGVSTQTMTDRTLTSNFIGRPNWNDGTQYSNMDLASLCVFDRALTDVELNNYTQNMLSGSTPLVEQIEFSVNGQPQFTTPAIGSITNKTISGGAIGKAYTGNLYNVFSNMDLSSIYLFDRHLSNSEMDAMYNLMSKGDFSLTRTTAYTPTGSNVVLVPPATSQTITSNTFSISDSSYGNGTFVVSTASERSGRESYRVFNYNTTDQFGTPSGTYNTTTGSQRLNLDLTGTGYLGSWIRLQMPYNLRLTRYQIKATQVVRSPRDFALFGSVDNVTWTKLDDRSNISFSAAEEKSFTVSTSTSYRYLSIIINRIGATDTAEIDNLKFYGIIDPAPVATSISGRYLQIRKPASSPALDTPILAIEDTVGSNVAVTKPVVTNTTLKSFVSPTIASPLSSRAYTPIQNGLIAWFDPNDPLCYSGTGATLGSLVGTGISGTIGGTSSFANGTIRLVNNSINASSNTSSLQLNSLTNMRTVSMWYYQHSTSSTSGRTLFDARTGGAGGTILSTGIGSSFTTGVLYENGGSSASITWNNIETVGVWQNVTVISTVDMTDNPTIFASNTPNNGLDVTFGPVLIYNRAITEEENRINFNEVLLNYFAQPNPTLPVTNGLMAWFDPSDPRSYPGTGATMTSLIPTSTSGTGGTLITGTLGGTYSYNTEGTIRLVNNSSNMTLNRSHLQLPSLQNITTVSIWYYQHSTTAGVARYILDMRTGGTGGFIWSGGIPGSNWETGTLYKNGGSSQSITWSNIETLGSWQNITVIANTPATDDMTIFARNVGDEGLDVTFGPIFIYNRALTESENRINYEIMSRRLLSLQQQRVPAPEFPHTGSRSLLYPPVELSSNSTTISSSSTSYGSGLYNVSVSSTSEGAAWNAFDGSAGTVWNGATGTYNTSTGAYSGTVSTTDILGNTYSGEYLEVKTPDPLYLKSISIAPNTTSFATSAPTSFSLLGAANKIDWVTLLSTTGTFSTVGSQLFSINGTTGTTSAYDTLRLVTTNIPLNNSTGTVSISEAQLFGGTIASSSSLQEFPPAAMTSATTAILGTSYGRGTYIVSASSSSGSVPFRAFDGNLTTHWHTAFTDITTMYASITGSYIGTTMMTAGSIGYSGEWLQLQTPNRITLDSFSIVPRQDSDFSTRRSPSTFYLFGSNNGTSWELIRGFSNVVNWTVNRKFFTVSSSTSYAYFRLLTTVVGQTGSRDTLQIAELKLYGRESLVRTREFPPGPMNANSTSLSGYPYGEGTYTSNVSSTHTSNIGSAAFDDLSTTIWRSSTLTSAKVLGQNGGSGLVSAYPPGGGAGGGGGATQPGSDTSTSFGGNGGQGYSSDIIGETKVYGSGGGGGARAGAGGTGGTNAGNGGAPGTAGVNGTGSGGGGSNNGSGSGGSGGSGVVVVRYNAVLGDSVIGSGGDTTTTFGNFKIHQFTNTGGSSFVVSQTGKCDILIVGGGGAGGAASTNSPSGGGGGGKVIHLENYSLTTGVYSISVGAGGVTIGGGNSSFDTIVALGGGLGNGNIGGSGGGGGRGGIGGTATAPSPSLITGTTLTNTGNTSGWTSSNAYNATTGAYAGSTSMTAGSTAFAGEWIQLQTPNSIVLSSLAITPSQTLFASASPNTWYLFGSTTGTTAGSDWATLYSAGSLVDWSASTRTFPVSTTTPYNYYRLLATVVGQTGGSRDTLAIADIALFGEEQTTNNFSVIDLGSDTQVKAIRLLSDTASANIVGSQLSFVNSAGVETYTKALDSTKVSYNLLDTSMSDAYSTVSTPFNATFARHNDSAFLFDARYTGMFTNDSVSVPYALRKTKDSFTLQTGSQGTSGSLIAFTNSVAINNSGGVAFGGMGTQLSRVFEGVSVVGTGNAAVNSFTITLPQTLAASTYRTFVTPEVPSGTEVFFVSASSKTTSTFVVNVVKSDATSWSSALSINWKVTF